MGGAQRENIWMASSLWSGDGEGDVMVVWD